MAIKKIIEVTDDITGKPIDGSFFGICLEGQRVNHDGDVLCDATLETEDLEFMSTFADITLTRESVLILSDIIHGNAGKTIDELKEKLNVINELYEKLRDENLKLEHKVVMLSKKLEEMRNASDQTEEQAEETFENPFPDTSEEELPVPDEMIAPPEEPVRKCNKRPQNNPSLPYVEMLTMKAEGKRNKEIAELLNIDQNSVNNGLWRWKNGLVNVQGVPQEIVRKLKGN